jgi:hypothetical protein
MRLRHNNPTPHTPHPAPRGARPGLSLVEVLVAIFIMGIGCVAILTLFPLGALNMAQALKDDRTAQAASQADAYMRWYWKAYLVETSTDTTLASKLDDADGPAAGNPPAAAGEPSYPVFVDPMGYYARGGSPNQSINGTLIPRVTLSLLGTQSNPSLAALRTCSLLDGYTFDARAAGQPINQDTTLVDREYRYNWAWVLQRPNNSDRNTAMMTVVVFDKRAHMYVPPNAERTFNPAPNGAAVGSSLIQFPAGTNTGLIKGGWIMDATSLGPPASVRNCHFYRVVSVTDNPGNGTVDVELQTPLKPDTQPVGAPVGFPGQWRTFVALAGVSEVFERPTINGADRAP